MRRSDGKTPTRAPSPLARGPEAARRSLQQARPDHVRAAWGPRARLAVGGWRERSRGGACTRTPPHLERPAPLGLPALARARASPAGVAWGGGSAPHVPAPSLRQRRAAAEVY